MKVHNHSILMFASFVWLAASHFNQNIFCSYVRTNYDPLRGARLKLRIQNKNVIYLS